MPLNTPKNALILLVDKPKGKTSYDVIRALKRRFPGQKIGHAGTLDPNATGLLIVGFGEGTKKLSEFLKLPKTYEVEILFGIKTDTGDITGKTVETGNTEHVTRNMVEDALAELVGKHVYPLPAYSAAKQGGVPLYKRARRGELVEPPEREMEVMEAKVKSLKIKDGKAHAEITFDVGSGTYIRSLAEELGKRLGVPATLKELRRTRIGDFCVKDTEVL